MAVSSPPKKLKTDIVSYFYEILIIKIYRTPFLKLRISIFLSPNLQKKKKISKKMLKYSLKFFKWLILKFKFICAMFCKFSV